MWLKFYLCLFVYRIYTKYSDNVTIVVLYNVIWINVKKIALGNKEHTTD